MAGFFHIPSDHWLEVDFSRWGEGGKRDGEKFALLKYAAIHHQKVKILYAGASGACGERVLLVLVEMERRCIPAD